MMNTALKFEAYQSLKAFSWHTDSGFSGEDGFRSFGFYRFMIPRGNTVALFVPSVMYDAVSRRDFTTCWVLKMMGFDPFLLSIRRIPASSNINLIR